MKVLNNISIRNRLHLMVFVSILFFIGFSIFAIMGITKANQLIDRLIDHPLVVSNAALDAQLSARELRDVLQDQVINVHDINEQEVISTFQKKEKELDGYLDIIETTILDEVDKQFAKETRQIVDEWKVEQQRGLQIILSGNTEAANSFFNEAENEYSNEVFAKIHEVNAYSTNKGVVYKEEAKKYQLFHTRTLIIVLFLFSIVIVLLSLVMSRGITNPISKLKKAMNESAETNQLVSVQLNGKNEIVEMSKDYNKLITILANQLLVTDGQTRLNDLLSGEQTIHEVATKSISFLAEYTNAGQGVFYKYYPTEEELQLLSSYAFTEREQLANRFKLGQGIVGQTALEKKPILLKNVNKTERVISTGTTNEAPLNTFTFPLLYENELYGVIELSSFEPIESIEQEFLLAAGKIIAINLFTTSQSERIKELLKTAQQSNEQLESLLEDTQKQAKELQVQQEELRQANEELEQQTEVLKSSEEKLKVQQEQLQVTNEELEERTKLLEEQKSSITKKNDQLLQAQAEIEEKAQQVEIASKYKSEFLANMSHELRTPLNSILVLSQMLAEKKDLSPLTEKQLQYARTIHTSGEDLLKLINEILDLSKVEAGGFDIVVEQIRLEEMIASIENQFREVATKNGLQFTITIDENIPETISTDRQRLEQIMKNLISNALKFTESGNVTIQVGRPSIEKLKDTTMKDDQSICFNIIDTGIGIPQDKQRIIFEAFQQVDGTISRKYGGTGLGLSISRELTKLLQGSLQMESTEGVGSTFSLIIPQSIELNSGQLVTMGKQDDKNEIVESIPAKPIDETVEQLEPILSTLEGKKALLVDDDMRNIFALSSLLEDKGMTIIAAKNGKEGIEKLKNSPDIDIILMDIMMPEMDGYTAIREIRKLEPFATIPIIAVTAKAMKEDRSKCIEAGANDYLTKPIDNTKLLSLVKVWLY